MRARYWAGLLAALVGSGCDGITTVSQLPATIRLRVGDEVRIPEQNLTLVLEEVVEDSRCPIDVVCVWEGRVVVRLTVIRPDTPNAEILLDSQRPDFSTGNMLRIVTVAPAPYAGVTILQGDYRVTLEIAIPPPSVQ